MSKNKNQKSHQSKGKSQKSNIVVGEHKPKQDSKFEFSEMILGSKMDSDSLTAVMIAQSRYRQSSEYEKKPKRFVQ